MTAAASDTATTDATDSMEEAGPELGIREARGTGWHRGAYVLRRDTDEHVELQVITLWESFDSIRAFAGTTSARRSSNPLPGPSCRPTTPPRGTPPDSSLRDAHPLVVGAVLQR
ncbi:hypothetical protein FAF44_48950 [Nonomuraea sp. MG754425]|nr:hypothetical protein [Nonomuraea sp. MG754425]